MHMHSLHDACRVISLLADDSKEGCVAGMTIEVDAQYPLRAFLPRNSQSFYRYEGSLTTPTCNEVVTWTIFDQAVPISEAQVSGTSNVSSLLTYTQLCWYEASVWRMEVVTTFIVLSKPVVRVLLCYLLLTIRWLSENYVRYIFLIISSENFRKAHEIKRFI